MKDMIILLKSFEENGSAILKKLCTYVAYFTFSAFPLAMIFCLCGGTPDRANI